MNHFLKLTGLAITLAAVSAPPSAAAPHPDTATYRHLAGEIHGSLEHDILSKWYPRAISAEGGFHQDYGNDWSPGPSEDRSIVYQSRLSWVAAQASMTLPDQRGQYRGYALRGLDVLENGLWDKEYGGFYWSVIPNGSHSYTSVNDDKQAYGISFGIYACTGIYKATHNPKALALAKQAYLWLDKHAHDSQNGGYVEALSRHGVPINAAERKGSNDAIGTPYGGKSMNTHIHLLESFTALYSVWPDPTLRKRLTELLHIVRDKVATPAGYLNLEFRPDWTPTSHADSYGHDIETAYLIVEAAEALGISQDTTTWTVSKKLVDHVLQYGLDKSNGGYFDHGPANGEATDRDKIWWTQAEALNSLLLMHERYGKSSSVYWNAFIQQWTFISQRQIDHQYGGWFSSLPLDGSPPSGRNKSDAWTDPYHQGRALMNVEGRLKRLASK